MAAADWAGLKLGVKETIREIDSIGKVETRLGGVPTWIERPRAKQAFWEISVWAALENDAGVGPQAFEDLTIRLEGFMPFDYDANTEAVWDTLLVAIRNALRNNPTLRDPETDRARISDTGRPQMTVNNLVTYTDGQKEVRCHHAVIEVRCRGWFTYSPA